MNEIITIDKDKLMETRNEVPHLVDQFMDAYNKLKNWFKEDNNKLIDNVKYTSRGFEYIDFKDRIGEDCSIQQSSLAFINAIWLGRENSRMELDESIVEQLVEVMQQWLKTGSFKKEK